MIALQSFSTSDLPPCERLPAWNHMTASVLAPQIAYPADQHTFCGRMTCLTLGELRLVELNASASTVTPIRAAVSRFAEPVYLLRMALHGNISILQGEQELHLAPGSFALCDPRRPYRLFFQDTADILIVRIPRARILPYVAQPEFVSGVVMSADSGLSGFASRHLRELWRATPDFLYHGASMRMLQITLQLIGAAYCALPCAQAGHSCMPAAHRAHILEFIERNLRDSLLKPAMIAGHLGLTTSYLHRLFSGETDTISRYILRRRLEECAIAITDRQQSLRSITTIAFEHGFSSLSHFSRAFQGRYDASPARFRKAHLARH
jgi:AraC family transcriptional activator of tynA and feaB